MSGKRGDSIMKPKMNRKKVLIYMSLLVIIISALWVSSWFIKINETETLYDFLCILSFHRKNALIQQ